MRAIEPRPGLNLAGRTSPVSAPSAGFTNGDDYVVGTAAAESMNAGGGDDYAAGGGGADTILGVGGDDVISGGSGADQLDGGLGNDIISGGSGVDRITGGKGRDDLRGGDGKDLFVYTAISDSRMGDGVDRVNDFTFGKDKVDISALMTSYGLSSITLVNGLHGVAGEVAYSGHGDEAYLNFDFDGDGVGDMIIVFESIGLDGGGFNFSVNDFIL